MHRRFDISKGSADLAVMPKASTCGPSEGEAATAKPLINSPSNGCIYLGDSITNGSERALISHLVEVQERASEPYVLLANCQFGGRQIDCILATAKRVVVFEAKATRWPVQGGINGKWKRRQADGGETDYTNAYSQALLAKNALRDAMAAGGSLKTWYPDARVVFTSGIPAGSKLTGGDHKVGVVEMEALDLGSIPTGAPWALDRWPAFARYHQLIPVSREEAVAPPDVVESFSLLGGFREAVEREYSRDGRCWLAETDAQSATLLASLLAGPGAFISGPSGCGKTLLARRAAGQLAAGGTTVLYLSARLYDGSWQALVRREVSLLSGTAPDRIYRAARRTGTPVAIILDGLNELPDADDALRGLLALAARLDARLIVTAQGEPPARLAGLEQIAVIRPSLELKQRIAGAHFGDAVLEALKAVGSGYEASVIGSIAGKIERHQSRQGLLDLYVRERLGRQARLGALGLRRLAAVFHASLAFSVSESDFDELMLTQAVPDAATTAMFASGLLVRHAGRISFAHEMLQQACAAHGLAISIARDPATWSDLLDTPLFEDIAGDVLSVVERHDVANAILAGSSRPAMLRAAMDGQHGAIAQAIAVSLLDTAYQDCLAEIVGLSLIVVPGERAKVNWNPASLRGWTPEEKARLTAIGLDIHTDRGIGRHMALCGAMDARLYEERQRVFEEAKAAGCNRLRSAAFELAYHGFGTEIGFLQLCRAVQHDTCDPPKQIPQRQFDVTRLTSGQLHFLLEKRYSLVPDTGRDAFAEQLIYCLEKRFAMEPYHVKLAILTAAGFARTASEEVTERLISAVQALEVALGDWGINSAVVDALQFLGAIEDPSDEYRISVRSEIEFAIGGNATLDRCEKALMLAGAQFDHPYGEIYYDEIEKLHEGRRRTLYRRALAADTRYCGNLAWMVRQITSWGDRADAPRMQVLAQLPDPTNVMPQEEWSAFVDAVRFLGRHAIALEDVPGDSNGEKCLAQVRALVHAAEDRANGGAVSAVAWSVLESMPVGHAIGALGEVQRALLESHWSERVQSFEHLDLIKAYPQQCLQLARAFLDAHAEATYAHRVVFHDVGPQFAFSSIATEGDRSDLERLRAHSFGPHARIALAALKKLDLVAG